MSTRTPTEIARSRAIATADALMAVFGLVRDTSAPMPSAPTDPERVAGDAQRFDPVEQLNDKE